MRLEACKASVWEGLPPSVLYLCHRDCLQVAVAVTKYLLRTYWTSYHTHTIIHLLILFTHAAYYAFAFSRWGPAIHDGILSTLPSEVVLLVEARGRCIFASGLIKPFLLLDKQRIINWFKVVIMTPSK